MPSRREFIQAGLAASVAPIAFPIRDTVSRPPHVDPVSSFHHSLYSVVSDVRSRWSADLAHEAERLGARVVRTNGDITDFWFADLARQWKDAPVAIGGLTARGPLFCLERFGWDHGLRVVFHGTHRFIDGGYVEHTLAGPFRTIAAAHSSLTGADWPSHLARLVTACAVTRDTASTTLRAAWSGERDADVDETLVSWVIAPKHA